jgi:hypothetical protein
VKLGEKLGVKTGVKSGVKLGEKSGVNWGEKLGEKLGVTFGEKSGLKSGVKSGEKLGGKSQEKSGVKLAVKSGVKFGVKLNVKLGVKSGSCLAETLLLLFLGFHWLMTKYSKFSLTQLFFFSLKISADPSSGRILGSDGKFYQKNEGTKSWTSAKVDDRTIDWNSGISGTKFAWNCNF